MVLAADRRAATSAFDGFDQFKVNGTLRPSRNIINEALIGTPRVRYGHNCQPATHPAFLAMLVTEDVGPFEVTGLKPAVAAVRAVFSDLKRDAPSLLPRIESRRMHACRLVRGSQVAVSNHSWGIALDIVIDRADDPRASRQVQNALLDVAQVFQKHGFFWGIAFRIQDAMHFEASEQLVRQWAQDGHFGKDNGKPLPRAMTIGDRGPSVVALQQALNLVMYSGRNHKDDRLEEDGIYGPATRATVVYLQRKLNLFPDGMASPKVLKALGFE